MADSRVLQILIEAKDNATKTLKSLNSGLDEAVSHSNRLAVVLAAAGATIGYFGKQAISLAGQLEQDRMAFKTLLGSIEEADKAIDMIKKDAASTPFELPGLIQANKLLTAVTKDAGRSETILLNVGKALSAMGKGQSELDRIIVNLQQIGAVGRASMLDVKQFAFAGIPIFEMLTEATGQSGEALSDLITTGGVTFEILEDMFRSAGEEGGRFANAFSDQAGTFNQLVSNMKDNLGVLGAEIIEKSGLMDLLKKGIEIVIEATEKLKNVNIKQWFDDNQFAIILAAGAITGMLVPAIYAAISSLVAMTIALGPYMVAGAVIGGLIAAFAGATGGIENFKSKIQEALEYIDQNTGLVSILGSTFERVWVVMQEMLIPKLIELWEALQPLQPIFTALAKLIGLILYGAFIAVVKILEISLIPLITILGNTINFVNNNFLKPLVDTIDSIWKAFEKVVEWVRKAISAIKEFNILQGAASVVGKVLGFGGARAAGGPVNTGKSYLVGEHGPELFTPNGNGRITPNGALGGGGIIVNVYGDVSGDELIQKVKNGIMSELGMNTKFAI